MKFSARQIADILQGSVEGDPAIEINTISKIEEAKPGSLTFLANPKYTPHIYTTKASAVIVAADFKPEHQLEATLIRVADAYGSFATLLAYYEKLIKKEKSGREDPVFVHETASLGEQVYIGAFAYIGENVKIGNKVKLYPQVYIGDNVEIGDDTIIYQGARVYHDCKIGKACTIHAGVTIGSDGFGFAPQSEDEYMKVPQIGNVILEDKVEIGAGTTIDRATIGSTIIKRGVKLDNLIQIAHNVVIGENTVIAAQSGISGSTTIGKNCMIGGQVGIIGHLKIGDNVKIAAQSGVGKDLKDGEIVQGSPAFAVGEYKRAYVMFRKLPDLNQKLSEIEKQMNTIKAEKHE